MSTIGKNISKIRKEHEMTQDQVAEKLHVTRQAVSNWENGKTQPDVETLGQLAECFEVPVEMLIYGKSETQGNKIVIERTVKKGIDTSTAVGIAMAVVLSYTKWKSIGWAIVHGFLNWAYILYYVIKY